MSETIAPKEIYQVIINAPVETVWSIIVKTDEVLPFLFGCVCKMPDTKPGSTMKMLSKDGKNAIVIGEVLEFTPPYRYTHTMVFTQYAEEGPCTVSYELRELENNQTELQLITTNVPAGTRMEKGMAQGGMYIVNTIAEIAEAGKPSFKTQMMLGFFGLMAPLTPKQCRAENWTDEKLRARLAK